MKFKIMLISGFLMFAITLLSMINSVYINPPKAPEPEQFTPQRKVTYMASKQFASLPLAEKEKYVTKLRKQTPRTVYRQLNDTERQAVLKNTRKVIFKRIKERTKKFFKMSEEEQNKYLDERIARWQKWREQRRQGNSSSRGRRHSGNRNAWRQGFIEGLDSTTRAQMMEIRRRIRARRKQAK
jgi:hypothetical protein